MASNYEEIKKEYEILYNTIDDQFHRIDILGLIEENNNIIDSQVLSEAELLRIKDIEVILSNWINNQDIDKLNRMYKDMKDKDIQVKSPNKFLIGTIR